MIVLGLIGRSDRTWSHDAAACLVVDGVMVGALEQERISGRRHAMGESADDAALALLTAHGLTPADVDAVGYAWGAPAEEDIRRLGSPLPGDVAVSPDHIAGVLPSLGDRLRSREVMFFDHHLCHAAQTYYMNPHATADVLVLDGSGGDCSTSLFHVRDGDFRLLERHAAKHSLGILYEAAAYYANMGWNAAGKLMGLASYAAPSGRRLMTFDSATGAFGFEPGSPMPARLTSEDGDEIAKAWLGMFEEQVFPYSGRSGNVFDYAGFAADVQLTLEELGLSLAERLHRLSGADQLLLSGGVALNAHMNRRIAEAGWYRGVAGTVAPHDGGTAVGAAMLTAATLGEPVRPWSTEAGLPVMLGPAPGPLPAGLVADLGAAAVRTEPDKVRSEAVDVLARGGVVAWFDGPAEFGPRALGARSLLADPSRRETLDRINRIKGRAPWRPAALSMTAEGFTGLGLAEPLPGLSEYMLCAHPVAERGRRAAAAGVHVDGTTRAQLVPSGTSFGLLLDEFGATTGAAPALINTSLNTRGEPMVLYADQAVALMKECPEVDLLVTPEYLVRR
ncbi:carbamoyltransferase C-terminal domain-containing protein [Streptomyces sp. TP-A0356]|uniref:carbamoyltransferase C-terminal domain-containing protein n=1 Tax=Streptomyces sp. TP-A0356 TaxID=1359208 RepID=UPI000AAA07BC|nr:carbamoyltransferase C-terminal domain-containing protein [Streptomyces sp. TP-A0356]